MTVRFRYSTYSSAAIVLLALAAVTGCRSYHVGITVENRTGAAIQLLEIDYPSASFGADSMAPGANLKYQVQVRGSAPIKAVHSCGRRSEADQRAVAFRG